MLLCVQPKKKAFVQTLNRIGWSMFLFNGVFFATAYLMELINVWGETNLTGRYNFAYILIKAAVSMWGYMFPFFVAGVFFLLLSRRSHTERIRFDMRFTPEFPLLILAGLALITAGSYVNGIFSDLIGFSVPTDTNVTGSYDNASSVILYMSTAIAPAFAEEFLFRGVFYSNLRPYGRTQAVLISSLLFALMHQNIDQLFYTFVAGIAMALMYELTGSIWCSVIYHLINNELAALFEIMAYGKVGEDTYVAMLVWDVIICALGLAATILLILHYRKKATDRGEKNGGEVFPRKNSPERYDAPLPAAVVVKGLLTPGIITFVSSVFAFLLLTWLLVLSL